MNFLIVLSAYIGLVFLIALAIAYVMHRLDKPQEHLGVRLYYGKL